MADSTTSNGTPNGFPAPPPRGFGRFQAPYAPRGRPSYQSQGPFQAQAQQPGALAPPPAFYRPPPRAPSQQQSRFEPRPHQDAFHQTRYPARDAQREPAEFREPRPPRRDTRQQQQQQQPQPRFNRGAAAAPQQATTTTAAPASAVEQTVSAPVVPPQFASLGTQAPTKDEPAPLPPAAPLPAAAAPEPQPSEPQQPQPAPQPAPHYSHTRTKDSKEPDQRMRRVLARDHSFCYRCARTGHYTKDCMWFKTQLCKYWQEGNCRHGLKNGENVCMYAHGQDELRPVTPAWCIRVVHDNGNMLVFGCGGPFHTPETCPQLINHLPPPPVQHQPGSPP